MAYSKIVVFALLVATACALPQEDSFTKDNRKAINDAKAGALYCDHYRTNPGRRLQLIIDIGFGGPGGFGGAGGFGPNGYGGYGGINRPGYPGNNGYNQFGYNPYSQNPYGQNHYGHNPYGQNPYGNRFGGNYPQGPF